MSQSVEHMANPAGTPGALELRVLVVAPTAQDAQMCQAILGEARLQMMVCADLRQVCREMLSGAAALLLTEEALAPEQIGDLMAALAFEPQWSELPILVLSRGGAESPSVAWVMQHLHSVVLLERPVQRLTLLTAVRAAVMNRQRQYQLRGHLIEQKRAEEAQREGEQRLRLFIEHAPAALAMFDRQMRYLLVSRRWLSDYGLEGQDLLGRSHYEVFPEIPDRWKEIHRRALNGEVICAKEDCFPRADGSVQWLRWEVRPWHDAAGEIAGIVAFTEDVTQQRAAREALRESERLYRAIGESIDYGIWVCDPQGRNTYLSESFLKLVGKTQEQCLAFGWTDVLHPDDADATLAAWKACIEHGDAWYCEHRYRGADGRWHPVLSCGAPVRNDEGEITAWAGINLDISRLKRAEEELAAAKGAAEQANAAKDQFLAVLSHELRTPLTPVLPALEELAAQVPEEAREDVEMARRNVELEARLIDDLLDVTRIARGKIELHRESVELETIVRRAAEVCAPDIEARQLHFGITVEGGPYPVEADPARLQQVFWNLLKNAVKFTPHGGCVGVCCQGQDGQVLVAVTDSGMGVEPVALPRLFNAFEQVDRAVTRQFGGLGLGLAISKALVEMHGGTIEAHSQGQGQGATFTVKLPLLKVAEGKVPGPEPEQAVGAPTAPSRPLQILLVEDHGDTTRIMRRMLQAKGHKVETAGDVATALELAHSRSFDLLLSDLGLPDRSGLELMQELQRLGREIPGIALSGFGQEEDVRRSREAGFAEHLTKPVNLAQLEAAIGRVGTGRISGAS